MAEMEGLIFYTGPYGDPLKNQNHPWNNQHFQKLSETFSDDNIQTSILKFKGVFSSADNTGFNWVNLFSLLIFYE